MSARATSERRRGREGEAMGVEEAGWAPVPQVTRRCYNPQRRPLKAANVRRCQLQVVPPSVPLLSASFSSSSSSRGVIFYFFAGEIYSVNRESGVFDPNPGPFILSPMWVSGSQPSSHWQIIQKQNEKKNKKLGGWMNFCSPDWNRKQTSVSRVLAAKWTQM